MTNGDSITAVRAAYACKPGDILIARKEHPADIDDNMPYLCKAPGVSRDHPTSTELRLRYIPYECKCLVIRPAGTGWTYVLAEGTLGWICHTNLSHLEPHETG